MLTVLTILSNDTGNEKMFNVLTILNDNTNTIYMQMLVDKHDGILNPTPFSCVFPEEITISTATCKKSEIPSPFWPTFIILCSNTCHLVHSSHFLSEEINSILVNACYPIRFTVLMVSIDGNWPNSQIPQCALSISHAAPFRTDTCTFCSEWCTVGYETGALWIC